MVHFQVFPDSAHQSEFERYQGHIKLDDKFPFHGAHGRLTYNLHDKNWIPHIGINNPSNCKADTKNKEYQGYCNPTTRTQETIVWFPDDTCTTFQVAKIPARMIKVHQKYFIVSIFFEYVNPDQLRHSNFKFRNIHNIESKLTRFQKYPETEFACKYTKPLRNSCRIPTRFRHENRKINYTSNGIISLNQ